MLLEPQSGLSGAAPGALFLLLLGLCPRTAPTPRRACLPPHPGRPSGKLEADQGCSDTVGGALEASGPAHLLWTVECAQLWSRLTLENCPAPSPLVLP